MNASPVAVRVKLEREQGGAGEAAAANLYAEVEVKEELVLGLERLQPQDIAYAVQRETSCSMRPSPVVRVKEELEWGGAGEAAAAGLYAEVEVKEELVLGPERLQPQDIAYAIQRPEATIDQKPTGDSEKSINSTADESTDILNHTHYIKEEKEQNEPDVSDIQIISNNAEEASTKDECLQANVNVIENESYICDDRGKSFQVKALHTTHIAPYNTLKYLNTTNNNLRWVCAPCNAKFATKSELINHEIEDHGSKIKYKACTLCNYKTVDGSKLDRHIKTHNNEKPYACNICDTKLSSSESLKRHVKSHTGEKPYQCTICNRKFSSCSSLKDHTRTHIGEKPYTCETCNLKFKRSNNLKRHAKTHNRPHQCQLCNLNFSLSSLLNRHIRTHTEAKPYVCTDCDSKFNNSKSLKRHSLIHTGIKPYNCTICNYKFRHSGTLKRHLRIHTDKNCIPVLPVTTKT